MLMMIGYLTTPTSSTGVSLSEFWAWVRYLAAISEDESLSLTNSFAELDAHQKTILSDDFGMGVPMLWLSEHLSLEQIVDGRYFMQWVAASVGAAQRRTAKRGPNKTPDFVARDTAGRWHVIECKGTQSGSEFSERQLGTKGPPPTGGIAQKCSIKFPAGHTGQRLVCGLNITVQGGTGSVLKIVDPEPDEAFEIGTNHLSDAKEAADRGVMSRALRMAGFEVTAETIASPFGRKPGATREVSRKTKQMLDSRSERSKRELRDNAERQAVFGRQFQGRTVSLTLPRGVRVNERQVRRVIIKQGVNRDILEALEHGPVIEDSAEVQNSSWAKLIGRSLIENDGLSARMHIGQAFRSELILEE
ncbi:hypothetical protein H3H37_20595 [Duganella sp. LX20W]|uniref:Uncharacterized protein n=2 Tax=Rugamonas brunnea TaxID=2758569 RepID=A0A7W2EVQ5_9BURK|nr:hypothetical protein [Rugamonas brunnea]